MFIGLMLCIVCVCGFFRYSNPRYFLYVGLLGLFTVYWTTNKAYSDHWGVDDIDTSAGESIRQDSTQTRTTFFGAYTRSRSHMGGGLMGGK